MKHMRALLITLAAILFLLALTACGQDQSTVLRIYSKPNAIDPKVIEMFEEETGIIIFHQTFDSDEEMYTYINNTQGASYDVVLASDYMVKQMASEEMLEEPRFDNIPNYKNVAELYDKMSYDKKRLYSVPYMGATLCLGYDPAKVTDVSSWDILWDPAYSNKVAMPKNAQDSLSVALKALGYSVNTKESAELDAAKQKLLEFQVSSGTSAETVLAVLRSDDTGDWQTTVPQEGTVMTWTAACILRESMQYQAEQFLDFLCRKDIAEMNAKYTGGISPLEDNTPENAELFDNQTNATKIWKEINN